MRWWVRWLIMGMSCVCACLAMQTTDAMDWELAYEFSSESPSQEETITVTMYVTNTNSEDLMMLNYLGIHFDWLQEGYYYANPDNDDDPVTLYAGASTTRTVPVYLDSDFVSIGSHEFSFYLQYSIYDSWSGIWGSGSGVASGQSDLVVRELDTDGDGVPDSWDAFPYNPSETVDTDNDGYGDNSDAFPYDTTEHLDSDSDGYGDNSDAFPNDMTEHFDSDGDGYGDSTDDLFPNDRTEHADSDYDGVGDNADAFPFDASEQSNSDKDGVGDNADAFPHDSRRWEAGDYLAVGSATKSMTIIIIVAIAVVLVVVGTSVLVRRRRAASKALVLSNTVSTGSPQPIVTPPNQQQSVIPGQIIVDQQPSTPHTQMVQTVIGSPTAASNHLSMQQVPPSPPVETSQYSPPIPITPNGELVKKCKSCGAVADMQDSFCIICGTQL